MTEDEQVIQTSVSLEWRDELIFKLSFDNPSLSDILIDEKNKADSPDAEGPAASKLLLSAVMGCLNASFLFCLQKSRVPFKSMKAKGIATIIRNEEGYLRIKQIDVELMPEIEIEKGIPRMENCFERFHNYCTITESVRNGIPVNVTINRELINK